MKDILPNASVRISKHRPRDFLDKVGSLSETVGITSEKFYDFDPISEMDILCLSPNIDSIHQGLFGQLISREGVNDRVFVEVRADRWSPDSKPNYDTYVNAIADVFASLIEAFNKKYGSRYRLTIQSREATEPTLPPKAQSYFTRFERLANKRDLHPLDWKRFYQFSRFCHVHAVKCNEEDIYRILVKSGFEEKCAREISGIYGHLRDFQRVI